MTAKCLSRRVPPTVSCSVFTERDLPRALRYRSDISHPAVPPALRLPEAPTRVAKARRGRGRRSSVLECAVLAVCGFGAAAYFGLYVGVASGIGEILAYSLDEEAVPLPLLQGLLRMLLGWVVFLALGLATAALIRHRSAAADAKETPEARQCAEKEHVLGYD